jgi:hypothetical protein
MKPKSTPQLPGPLEAGMADFRKLSGPFGDDSAQAIRQGMKEA